MPEEIKKAKFSGPSFEILGLVGSILTILQSITVFYLFIRIDPGGESQLKSGILITIIALSIITLVLSISLSRIYLKNHNLYRGEVSLKDSITKTLKEREYYKRNIEILSKVTHNISHEIRNLNNDMLLNLFEEYSEGENDDSLDADFIYRYERIREDVKSFLGFFCGNLKDFFSAMVKDDCSVYILIVVNKGDNKAAAEVQVETFWRDYQSYVSRQKYDREKLVYNKNEFYPIEYIITDKNMDSVYICDNCAQDEDYSDRFPQKEWINEYNAIIASPIQRVVVDREKVNRNLFGFLVVDNKKGGFKNEICENAVRAFSDKLYNFFSLVWYLESILDQYYNGDEAD